MLPLDPSGRYSAADVARVLHGLNGPRRMSYRFERLDVANQKIGDVDWITGGRISNNALADLKRTATFDLLDRATINYLSDRIKPYAILTMPDTVRRVTDWIEDRRNLALNPVARGSVGFSPNDGARHLVERDVAVTDHPLGIPSAVRSSARAGVTTTELASLFNLDGLLDTGPQRYLGAWVKPTRDVRAWWGHNAGSAAAVTAPANVWTWVPGSGPIVANAYTAFFVAPPTGNATPVTDSVLITGVAAEVPSQPDGSDVAWGDRASTDPLVRYRWLGTSDASASVRETGVVRTASSDNFVEWPLGVFLLETPKRVRRRSGAVVREVKAYDLLAVLAEDRYATRKTYPAGAIYTDAIAEVAGLGNVPAIVTPSTATMPTAMEWEPGTSRLRVMNDLLSAINYESAWIDPDGNLIARPYLAPSERSPEYRYVTDDTSVIATSGLSQELDIFDVPNQWVLVVSEADRPPLTTTYTNNNPLSPTSTVSRGRTITDFRDNEDAPDLATLEAKARRLAFEASQVIERITFETLGMPFHVNADVLALKVDDLVVDGIFSEQSWEYDLAAGATMKHTVRRVVTV